MNKTYLSWLPDWVGVGIIAGLMWGAWALVANYEAGMKAALMAGATQFTMSFITASGITILVEKLLEKLLGSTLRIPLAMGIPIALIFAAQYGAHSLTGTPNIIITILPALTMGSAWCIVHGIKLLKLEQQI